MKLGALFSSTTGSCTATSIVALACCGSILAIRANRDSRDIPSLQHELRIQSDDLPVALLASREVPAESPDVTPVGPSESDTQDSTQLCLDAQTDPLAVDAHEDRIESPPLIEIPLDAESTIEQSAPLAELGILLNVEAPVTSISPSLDETDANPIGIFVSLATDGGLDAELTESVTTESESDSDDSDSLPAVNSPSIETEINLFLASAEPEAETEDTDVSDMVPFAPAMADESNSRPAGPLALIPRLDEASRQMVLASLAPAAQRAEQGIQRAFALADKGALYSARKQLESALQTVAHGLDVHHDMHAHSDCLAEGLVALQEARDFLPSTGNARSRPTVPSTAAKHQSLVLTKSELEQIEAPEAMRRYCAYAQERLVAATGGIPVASHAYFGLGKLAMSQATQSPSLERAHHLSAMILFQVALETNGANYSAANELGVLLARDGRLNEAKEVLQQGVAVRPLAETWHNLMVVHRRLGAIEQSERAQLEWQRAVETAKEANPNLVTAANGPSVHWVDKTTFERGGLPTAGMTMSGEGALR